MRETRLSVDLSQVSNNCRSAVSVVSLDKDAHVNALLHGCSLCGPLVGWWDTLRACMAAGRAMCVLRSIAYCMGVVVIIDGTAAGVRNVVFRN